MLHGVGPDDVEAALGSVARPVLNTRRAGRAVEGDRAGAAVRRDDRHRHEPARAAAEEIAALDGLAIDTLMSHLACADEDHPLNAEQLRAISRGRRGGAGEALQPRQFRRDLPRPRLYFDLVRPGLALYGGVPRREAEGNIRQVAHVEAQIVQRRTIRAGESCGYGATFVAEADTEAAILNIGYADGYLRGFSARGSAFAGEFALPVLGPGVDGFDRDRL